MACPEIAVRFPKSFPFALTDEQMTHPFFWSRDQVKLQSLQGYHDDDGDEIKA